MGSLLLEQLFIELLLHLLNLLFVKVNGCHHVLVAVLLSRDYVNVAFRDLPVRHCATLDVIQLVQKDPRAEIKQPVLLLVSRLC